MLADPRGGGVAGQVNLPEVAVGFPHQAFAFSEDVGLRIAHRLRQFPLQTQGEDVSGTALQDMQPLPEGQEEPERGFGLGGFARPQPPPADQLPQRRTFPGNPPHPAQVVKIPQASQPRFEVGLLDKNRASFLGMPGRLVFQPPGKVILHAPQDVPPPELLLEFLPETDRSGQPAGVKQGGLDHRIGLRAADGFRKGPAGMPHLHSQIPEDVKDLFHHLLRRAVGGAFLQKNQVNVTGRAHLLPPETAHRPEHQTIGRRLPSRPPPEFFQDDGDQLGPPVGQIQPGNPRPRLLLQTPLLHAEESPVHVEDRGGIHPRPQRGLGSFQNGPQPGAADRPVPGIRLERAALHAHSSGWSVAALRILKSSMLAAGSVLKLNCPEHLR